MDFPNYPEGASSLARQYLTPAIFKTLKTKKTCTGFTLAQALRSGIANGDSAIGLYAGDAQCYEAFAALFLPVIQAYHRFAPREAHRTDRSALALPSPDPHGRYIVSTRIRVARNLENIAFTPSMDARARREVAAKVRDCLKSLPAPLSGRYISMEKEGDPRDAGLLFPRGDRFQETAGINRDWPTGRGCFVSQDKKFRVWINEEDHLRIISMDDHGDMGETFNRLCQGLDLMEARLSFARDLKLGYLAACPSNIGTGMRAGVHIRLPRLFKHPDLLAAEARQLNLQVRGTRGEKTRVEKAIFDISNEKRLGITEKECVQTLYHGICRLIRVEEGTF